MIVVVGGIKGGCGKTTFATNLVIMRSIFNEKKVLLVDADEQKSASKWATIRHSQEIETPWTTIQLAGHSVYTEIKKMGADYDDIIVDTGGRDTTSQRSALCIAEAFIAPFQPRSLDIWTVGEVKSLLSEIYSTNPGLISYAVINRADPQGKDNNDALEILREAQCMRCLDTYVGQRKSFANAASEGLGVMELSTMDKKACAEIQKLHDVIFIP
jgi:chromosome partitioning protein